jgi:hypothetical protein
VVLVVTLVAQEELWLVLLSKADAASTKATNLDGRVVVAESTKDGIRLPSAARWRAFLLLACIIPARRIFVIATLLGLLDF